MSLASQDWQRQAEEGRQAIGRGDYAEALRLLAPAAWFRRAADRGSAEAERLLRERFGAPTGPER